MIAFKRRAIAVIAGLATAATLSACGGSDDSGSADDGKISFALFPNSVLSLPLAVAQGEKIFEEEGLEVEMVEGKTGPELIAMTIGGTTDIAGASSGTAIPALGQGQELVVMPPYQKESKIIAARKDSGATKLEDLAGKTVAVPARGGDAETFLTAVMEEKGVDSSKVTFVATGAPASLAVAMLNGKVDAMIGTTSTVELLKSKGGDINVLASAPDGTAGERGELGLSSFMVTTPKFKKEHPEKVKSFCRALQKSTAFIADEANKDAVVKYLMDWVGVPQESAEVIYEKESDSWFNEVGQEQWDANVGYLLKDKKVSYDVVENNCA